MSILSRNNIFLQESFSGEKCAGTHSQLTGERNMDILKKARNALGVLGLPEAWIY